MNYKIKSIKVGKLILTCYLFLIVTIGTVVFLSSRCIVQESNPILPILFFGGIGCSIFIFFFYNHGDKICTITKDEVIIDNAIIRWDEVKSYLIKDDSPEFKTLKIKCRNEKTISIGHRKKFAAKDDFECFARTFENKVFNLNQDDYNISKTTLIWETKMGRWYGYVIVVLLIAFPVAFFINDFKIKSITNYLIFLGLSVPILIRIFGKKTTKR